MAREHEQAAEVVNNKENAKKIIDLLNSISEEVKNDAAKERLKPKYRFFDSSEKYEDVKMYILSARNNVENYGFNIEIIEDMDCFDVTSGSKYTVFISDENGTYIELDLLGIKKVIKNYEIDFATYIMEHISKITGDTSLNTYRAASAIADYLACAIYFKEEYVKTYDNLGWDYWYGSPVFKYDSLYSNTNMYGKYKGNDIDSLSTSSGDESDRIIWFTQMAEIMNYSGVNSMLMGAGVSGVIRQLLPYTKETNININIVGERASGKSTICHFILSMFGNPSKLEGSFTDTRNSAELIRVKKPVLPYVLDERMLRTEEGTTKNEQLNIIMDIFREYEGKVKERVGKQYEKMSGARTCGSIISSSVRSMMDAIYDYDDLGQFRRFIEFKVKAADLFKNKAMAEDTELIANSRYGFGVEALINYMLTLLQKDEDYFINRFYELNSVISETLDKIDIKGIESSSQRFALIVLSYQILREAVVVEMYKHKYSTYGLDETFDIDDEALIKDKSDEIINLLIENVSEKMKRVNQKIENHIYEYVKKYKDAFCTDKDGWNGTACDYIGKVVKDTETTMCIELVHSLKLQNILFSPTIAEPQKIKEYMKAFYSKEDKGTNPEASTKYNRMAKVSDEFIKKALENFKWITIEGLDKQRNRKFLEKKEQRAVIITIDIEEMNKDLKINKEADA